MELVKFRVQKARSIENSGDIEVSKISALVGRNESGKSNLLLALASLSPKGKRKPLNPVKDFPRSRRIQRVQAGDASRLDLVDVHTERDRRTRRNCWREA